MDKMFHITTLTRAEKILKEGILPNKKQIWTKRSSDKFPKGYIFTMTDYLDAVRWAYKTFWDVTQQNFDGTTIFPIRIVIVVFESDSRTWENDGHIESVGYRKKWLKTKHAVPPQDILGVITDFSWMKDVPKVCENDYLTRPDKFNIL